MPYANRRAMILFSYSCLQRQPLCGKYFTENDFLLGNTLHWCKRYKNCGCGLPSGLRIRIHLFLLMRIRKRIQLKQLCAAAALHVAPIHGAGGPLCAQPQLGILVEEEFVGGRQVGHLLLQLHHSLPQVTVLLLHMAHLAHSIRQKYYNPYKQVCTSCDFWKRSGV